MSKESEIGTLIVVVLKARNLNDKHKFRKQDAFAKISLNGTEKQTNVEIKGGQHPVWDEEFRFPVMKATGKKFRTLEVSCYAKEPRSDDLLGMGTVDISQTLQTGEFDDWVPISIDGVTRGDVYLEMTYYANGPPPPAAVAPAPTPSINVVQPSPVHGGLKVPGPGPQIGSGPNLMRRPSKLSPADRLSRPGGGPAPALGTSPTAHKYGHQRLPSIPDVERPPPSAQPPQPVPNLLRPGGTPKPKPIPDTSLPYANGTTPTPTPPTAAPTAKPNPYLIARPSTANPTYHASPPSVQQPNTYLTPQAPYTYPPQHGPQPAQQPPLPTPPYYDQQQPPQGPLPGAPAVGGLPILWAGSDPVAAPPNNIGGFAFPTPSMPGGYPTTSSPPNFTPRVGFPSRGHERRPSDPRDYITRYSTPLPLPPGNRPSPPPAQKDYHRSSPPPPPPPPAPPASPPRAPASPPPSNIPSPDQRRLEQLRRAEEEAARRRDQELRDRQLAMQLDLEGPASPPAAAAPSNNKLSEAEQRRLEYHKRIEEDAQRRREQELRDLELAMQLDKELNL